MEIALDKADQLIEALKTEGLDYSEYREELSKLWDDGLWEGNWDVTTDLPAGVRNIRIIQEDEYDQHMDDGPSWDSMLFSRPEYTWFAD